MDESNDMQALDPKWGIGNISASAPQNRWHLGNGLNYKDNKCKDKIDEV